MFFTSFVEVSFELLYAVLLSLHDKHQLQLIDYILNFAVSRETFSFYMTANILHRYNAMVLVSYSV